MTDPSAPLPRNPLPDVMVGWSAARFAAFVKSCVRFLNDYDRLDIGSKARLDLVLGMEATQPIGFSPRIEPRRTIVMLFQAAAATVSSSFYGGIEGCIRDCGRQGVDDLHCLVSLLVETKHGFPSNLVFLALTQIEGFDAGQRDDRTVALLVSLIPSDGGSVIAMLERLKRKNLLSPPVLESALRTVAQSDPGQLSTLLQRFGGTICVDDDIDSLQFLLDDLVERAGGFTVLKAVCILDPQNCPSLFKAAFAGPAPPYALTKHISGKSSDSSTHVRFRDRFFDLESLGRKPQAKDWPLRVGRATDRPAEIIATDARAGDGDTDGTIAEIAKMLCVLTPSLVTGQA